MLRSFPDPADGSSAFGQARWIDLIDPTESELAQVRDQFGLSVPTKEDLEEIEASSRLNASGDVLTMSAPLISGTTTDRWQMAPVGFVLSPRVLVTVGFAKLEAFDTVGHEMGAKSGFEPSEAFTRLLEEVIDRAADQLERASPTISEVSTSIFFDAPDRQRLSRDTANLREIMRKIGRVSDHVARTRYAFLSIGRMADFVLDRCLGKFDEGVHERLEGVRRDIASLDEFESSVSNRIQFLQDSAVGFISIEQNDVVKVLTVVSVVGVPPVLVVGIYGMNFKFMPELNWHYGYPYALALCVASAILPLIWFKWRDWI